MDKSGKVSWKSEISTKLDKSLALYVADYAGMTVEELSSLRRELKKADADFCVVKNTIFKKAVLGRSEEKLSSMLKGQSGVVYAFGDIAAAAKALAENAKKCEKLKVKGGFLDSSVLNAKEVEAIASLPSKEVLLSKIVGSLIAPHRGLLGVMNGVPRAIVSVLNQIKETKTA